MMIFDLWNKMEAEASSSNELIIRRYGVDTNADIYAAFRQSTYERGIALSIQSAYEIDLSRYTKLKDIRIERLFDEYKPENTLLLILLSSKQHIVVFSVLCTDLIEALGKISTEQKLVKELFNRLEKWISLFELASANGLCIEAQRGLFGELYLLQKLLEAFDDKYLCVKSWQGPSKVIRDFQLNDWAIEVKTTHGNNHQRICISSERQLDCSKIESLFLYHISLESRQQAGITLNQLILKLRTILDLDFIALNGFNMKLMEAGYFDHQAIFYNETGYLVRAENYYRVHKDFPRIEENDVRPGVGDVKYSIIVSQASEYIQSEEDVFKILSFYE